MNSVKSSVFLMLLGSTRVKAVCRTLMKLTAGLNFINVLSTAFTSVDPKSVKRYWWLDWVLMILGSTRVKAVRRTLMKSTPEPRNSSQQLLEEKVQCSSAAKFSVMTISTSSFFLSNIYKCTHMRIVLLRNEPPVNCI